MKKIILASASPRRQELLQMAAIPFEVIVPNTSETFTPGADAGNIAMEIAVQKAMAVQQKTGGNEVILAADTIVVLDDDIIGKPKNYDDAVKILTRLQGRGHRVVTGVALQRSDKAHTFFESTQVTFHPLTQQQIAHYVTHYQPYDKAGAYAIQEWIGLVGIKKIDGDFYNVMGLPISRVIQSLAMF